MLNANIFILYIFLAQILIICISFNVFKIHFYPVIMPKISAVLNYPCSPETMFWEVCLHLLFQFTSLDQQGHTLGCHSKQRFYTSQKWHLHALILWITRQQIHMKERFTHAIRLSYSSTLSRFLPLGLCLSRLSPSSQETQLPFHQVH